MNELSVIQKTYDLIKWYIPILNRLPRDHKFVLGEHIGNNLYALLEGLTQAKFAQKKLPLLDTANCQIDILRHQTRLLHDFELISTERYEYASLLISGVGAEVGGWRKQQLQKETPS
jgi:hypothetical protein